MQALIEKFREYCAVLGERPVLHTAPRQDGSPHVELVDGSYHYVVTERGSEFQRRIAESEDELLFWLVSDLVSGQAGRYELEHRIPGRSFRRQLFARKIELMEMLNPAWAERTRREIRDILAQYPYDDAAEG